MNEWLSEWMNESMNTKQSKGMSKRMEAFIMNEIVSHVQMSKAIMAGMTQIDSIYTLILLLRSRQSWWQTPFTSAWRSSTTEVEVNFATWKRKGQSPAIAKDLHIFSVGRFLTLKQGQEVKYETKKEKKQSINHTENNKNATQSKAEHGLKKEQEQRPEVLKNYIDYY